MSATPHFISSSRLLSRLPAAAPLAAAAAGTVSLGAAGLLALQQWRLIRRAAQAARRDRSVPPFEHHPPASRRRVLIVGDSTGVGLGIDDRRATLPGLLAAHLHDADIVNLCRSGARVRDVARQLARPLHDGQRFDLVLVFAGGNDVLRATPLPALAAVARRVGRRAAALAPRVLWLGNADVGTAPVFLPPLAWWMSWRSRRVARALADGARSAGVAFVDFAAAPHGPRFAADTARYFAADGLHPSANANAYCFKVLMAQPALRTALGRAPRSPSAATLRREAPFRLGKALGFLGHQPLNRGLLTEGAHGRLWP